MKKQTIDELMWDVVQKKAHTGVYYADAKSTITATRRLVRGKIPSKGNIDMVITIGRPNYKAREFLKRHKKDLKSVIGHVFFTFVPKKK